MGQRTQLIVQFKHNGSSYVGVFHNQWGYGNRLITELHRRAMRVAELKDYEFDSPDDFLSDLMECELPRAGGYKGANDEGWSWYFLDGPEEMTGDLQSVAFKTARDWVLSFDNNNGWAYLNIDGDKVQYSVACGSEETYNFADLGETDVSEGDVMSPRKYISVYTEGNVDSEIEDLEEYFEEVNMYHKLEELKDTIGSTLKDVCEGGK